MKFELSLHLYISIKECVKIFQVKIIKQKTNWRLIPTKRLLRTHNSNTQIGSLLYKRMGICKCVFATKAASMHNTRYNCRAMRSHVKRRSGAHFSYPEDHTNGRCFQLINRLKIIRRDTSKILTFVTVSSVHVNV